jgi:beta-glucosidase-like glycosyl hydrolase
MATYPYKDPQLSIAQRVSDLLGRMTLPEKIAQMYSHWLILSADGNHRIRADAFCQTVAADSIKEKLRLGIGQITRPLGTHPVNPQEGVRALNALQKFLVEETRLGIPAISHEECLMGLMVKGATLFPSALNYGSTWNPDLIEAVGQEIRKEAKQIGCHQGLAPVLDVSRDVRWGRTEETMGEDAGVNLLYTHHRVAKDKAEAAALAFNSGLDVELPGFECAEHLEQAVERHQISEEKINEIVARVLAEKFRLGLFENPYVDENQLHLQSDNARNLAKEVALQSVVLLENRGILPLDASKKPKVAVIGPTADDQLAMFGGYSFPVHLIVANMQEERVQYAKTPLQALTERFGASNVRYVKGCDILTERNPAAPVFPGDVDTDIAAGLERSSPISRDTSQIPDAAACARQSDVAIVFVGDLAGLFQTGTVGEGSDTDTLQ